MGQSKDSTRGLGQDPPVYLCRLSCCHSSCSTYDVVVERVHCECGTNGGVPIVAAGGTVRDVLYADMTVIGTNQVRYPLYMLHHEAVTPLPFLAGRRHEDFRGV